MTAPPKTNEDNDLKKGAVEDQAPDETSMNSMSKQLGQRDEDPAISEHDSNCPKPPMATS